MALRAALPRPLTHASELVRQEVHEFARDKPSLCLFGLSLYWAWIWSLLIANGNTLPDEILVAGIPASTMEYVARAAALVAVIVFMRLLPVRALTRFIVPAASVLGPLGVILLASGAPSASSVALVMVGWALVGVADGLLLIGWLDLYRFIGMRRSVIVICLSTIASVPLLVMVGALTGPVAVAVRVLLPLACALSLRFALSACPENVQHLLDEPAAKPTEKAIGYVRTIVLIAVYGIVLGGLQATSFGWHETNVPFEYRALGICLGTLLALAVNLSPAASDTGAVFRVALPVTACGLLLVQLAGNRFDLAAMLIIGGFFLFDIISITMLIRLSSLFNLPATAALGIGRLANTLGILLGQLGGHVLLRVMVPSDSLITTCGSILMLALVVSSGFLINTKTGQQDDGASSGDKNRPSADDTTDGPEHSALGRWRRQCELVSTQYGLSPREREVLVLLAKGRDAEYISTLFVISPYTAKTHIHNVYKKLGIHSQQDLIDLVEAAASELKTP